MRKLKKLFTNVRIIILLVMLILALIAIHPTFDDRGVAIRSVAKNSSASLALPVPIPNPEPGITPTNRERIISINNRPVNTEADYYNLVNQFDINTTFTLKTNKNLYRLTVLPEYNVTILNETETKTITEEVFDEELNETVNVTKTIEVPKVERELIGPADVGLSIYPAPTNNIRKGLDLEGGTRVLLAPEEKVSKSDLGVVIDNLKERLNVYGISDVVVRSTKDFSGNDFISIEIAGINKEEIAELLGKQGKFEAKVGEATVFKGGDDVKYVCRTADCSGIDPNQGCSKIGDTEFCRFRFSIALSPEAAQRQADATKDLDILFDDATSGSSEGYLSENLSLYLDDELVDALRIGSDLKGNPVTDISISGSGSGVTREEAIQDALNNMKRLQTIMITGSLPVKLTIVKTDTVSPVLGKEFIKNALFIGLFALIAVVTVVVIRYRNIKISVPMVITMTSELIIILGLASLIGWRLDLAAIAGIIIAIGTGVDHQIIITDETLRGESVKFLSWNDRLKKAFFIIMAAYFTTIVAMVPLWFAGAGLLKGFALTTILGVSIGVFITRPAFAAMMEMMIEKS